MDKDLIIEQLISRIFMLEKEVSMLQAELEKYKHQKNSSNSSIPPSKDENRVERNKSLRNKSDKHVGGQVGHEGKTLTMSAEPDVIEKHTPSFCQCCGRDISDVSDEFIEKRQIIDIPVIKPTCTEHQIYGKRCKCGHITSGIFPSVVKSSVQYGPNTEALVSYLHSRQYIPFNRIEEMMEDVFGTAISEGGIHCLLNRFTEKLRPYYRQIKERIFSSDVVGTDETGCKVNGKKHWFWTWQNKQLTYIVHSTNRGIDTIKSVFAEGLPNSILTHDRWASHFYCKAVGHQLCTSHLQRDLNYLEELYDSKWASEMNNLISQALALKKQMSPEQYNKTNKERNVIEENLSELLTVAIEPSHKKAITLQKSLRKRQDCILLFLYHPKVPPDNNGSERSIRNIKVKQKVSGQFKSEKGAEIYAINRSIIDTINKSNQNILDGLFLIANFGTD